MARCILIESRLPPKFWDFAFLYAVYLKNRLYHSTIKTTPYEEWNKEKPDLSYIRVFGCLIILLMYDFNTRKVVTKAFEQCQFHEDKFPGLSEVRLREYMKNPEMRDDVNDDSNDEERRGEIYSIFHLSGPEEGGIAKPQEPDSSDNYESEAAPEVDAELSESDPEEAVMPRSADSSEGTDDPEEAVMPRSDDSSEGTSTSSDSEVESSHTSRSESSDELVHFGENDAHAPEPRIVPDAGIRGEIGNSDSDTASEDDEMNRLFAADTDSEQDGSAHDSASETGYNTDISGASDSDSDDNQLPQTDEKDDFLWGSEDLNDRRERANLAAHKLVIPPFNADEDELPPCKLLDDWSAIDYTNIKLAKFMVEEARFVEAKEFDINNATKSMKRFNKRMQKTLKENRASARLVLQEKVWTSTFKRHNASSAVESLKLHVSDLPDAKTLNFNKVMKSEYRQWWIDAMLDEMESHKTRGTWETVPKPNGGTNIIGSKWVYSYKTDANGYILKFKARLVATGYSQTEGEDYNETFSPVVRIQSIRILLAIALMHDLDVEQMDVSTAYLYAPLDIPNFMKQPKGFEILGDEEQTLVCKLLKSLYGLHQSARAWYKCISAFITSKGFTVAESDPCVFYRIDHKLNKLQYIIVYVDDLLVISNSTEFTTEIKDMFKDRYEMNDLGSAKWVLGIQMEKTDDGVWIGQPLNAKEILESTNGWSREVDGVIAPTNVKPTPMSTTWVHDDESASLDVSKSTDYRSILMQTRPDIQYTVNVLAQYFSKIEEIAIGKL